MQLNEKVTWDLGLQLEAKDWSEIWEATKSASQNRVALEMNYKVLMRWYLVPAWIAKYMSTYSPNCFCVSTDAGTHHHIWWTCPLVQTFWTAIFHILSTLFNCPLNLNPAMTLLNKKTLEETRPQFKLLLQITDTEKQTITKA